MSEILSALGWVEVPLPRGMFYYHPPSRTLLSSPPLYPLLGLGRGVSSTATEIKGAWFKLKQGAVGGGRGLSQRDLELVNSAYVRLRDPESKLLYDHKYLAELRGGCRAQWINVALKMIE